MPDPRAFISFDFDNNSTDHVLFVGQIKNSRTPFNVEDWSSKTELPQDKWEDLIKKKINKCNMLIVLVGKKAHKAAGVIKEIKFAKQHNVPIFGVFVGGADDKTTLPDGITRHKTIKWDWDKIADQVEIMIIQGKNKM